VVMFRSSLVPRSARLDPLSRASAERLQALVAIAVDLSSSSGVENASSGGHVAPGNVISMSHRPDLRLEPTHLPLSWRARELPAAKLPECFRCLVTMRSVCRFQAQ